MFSRIPTRVLYKEVRLLEEQARETGNDSMNDFVVEMKREVRRRNRVTRGGRVFHDTGVSYIRVEAFPPEIQTREDAEYYFNTYMRMEYVPSAYDCTGQLFTFHYHVGMLGGKWVLWNWIALDV